MPVFFQSFGGGFPGGAQQFFNGGFPGGFEGMGGMGGMPGQGQGGPPQSDNTKFYKLLGVEKDAGEAEIKKAYKRMAIKNHPDKGGDPEKFKEISHAYEVRRRPARLDSGCPSATRVVMILSNPPHHVVPARAAASAAAAAAA